MPRLDDVKAWSDVAPFSPFLLLCVWTGSCQVVQLLSAVESVSPPQRYVLWPLSAYFLQIFQQLIFVWPNIGIFSENIFDSIDTNEDGWPIVRHVSVHLIGTPGSHWANIKQLAWSGLLWVALAMQVICLEISVRPCVWQKGNRQPLVCGVHKCGAKAINAAMSSCSNTPLIILLHPDHHLWVLDIFSSINI